MKLIFLILICHSLVSGMSFAQNNNQPFEYDDKGKIDPFIPLVDEYGRYVVIAEDVSSISELKLQGILWDAQGESSALINSQIVKKGESIGGFIIEEITKYTVKICKDNESHILSLSILEEEQIE